MLFVLSAASLQQQKLSAALTQLAACGAELKTRESQLGEAEAGLQAARAEAQRCGSRLHVSMCVERVREMGQRSEGS